MLTDAYARAQQAQGLALRRRRRAARTAARHAPRNDRQGAPPSAGSPSQRQGYAAESLALRHLNARGLRILARNLRCKAGEIDLVACQGSTLVFIEVRQRRDRRHGGATASVNRPKQARLIRAARYFLPLLSARHFAGRTPVCRFDVVSVEGEQIDWIQDAFRS
ncbi:YraN family protein [Castellaniella sp. MT123]|uniref:YraN family protein n=1 Tax=Castellaniella sp. MT123 TaxID=3140381 RepID=UPI0031F3A3FF